MTTLSPTKARANLTHWLKRAAAGEDVGILCGDKVIALRPVQVFSEDSDYAKREYGVTDAELDAFVKRMDAELERDRKAGRLRRYKGNLHATLRD
jgi:antitoxin (DNA-binding transcriptional repressor) of toxin-antitoxin stability system